MARPLNNEVHVIDVFEGEPVYHSYLPPHHANENSGQKQYFQYRRENGFFGHSNRVSISGSSSTTTIDKSDDKKKNHSADSNDNDTIGGFIAVCVCLFILVLFYFALSTPTNTYYRVHYPQHSPPMYTVSDARRLSFYDW